MAMKLRKREKHLEIELEGDQSYCLLKIRLRGYCPNEDNVPGNIKNPSLALKRVDKKGSCYGLLLSNINLGCLSLAIPSCAPSEELAEIIQAMLANNNIQDIDEVILDNVEPANVPKTEDTTAEQRVVASDNNNVTNLTLQEHLTQMRDSRDAFPSLVSHLIQKVPDNNLDVLKVPEKNLEVLKGFYRQLAMGSSVRGGYKLLNESLLEGLSCNIFITNFHVHSSAKELWNTCAQYD
ncbi:hypothetical protein Tco_0323893 [Tanacetum coccineum]